MTHPLHPTYHPTLSLGAEELPGVAGQDVASGAVLVENGVGQVTHHTTPHRHTTSPRHHITS